MLPDNFRIDELNLAAMLVGIVSDLETALRKSHPALLACVVMHRASLADVPAQNNDLEEFVAVDQATGITVWFPDQVRVEFCDRDPAVGYRFFAFALRYLCYRNPVSPRREAI